MNTIEDSRVGLKRMSAESLCAVAKPSIPIAIEGHDVKIFTDNIEETALEQIKELLSNRDISIGGRCQAYMYMWAHHGT